MDIGLMLPVNTKWFRAEETIAVCDAARRIGIKSLWFVDHVVLPPGPRLDADSGYMDCYTAMAFVAAVTATQGWMPQLGTVVVAIPLRPPIQQAKIVATLDSVSGGRLILGAGAGDDDSELQTLGVPRDKRGEMTDEYLKCMIELWTSPVASFHGKYVNFDEMTISVRPAQQPHPPIWYAGRGARPFQRVVEMCQGYLTTGMGGGPGQFEADMNALHSLAQERGRNEPIHSGFLKFASLLAPGSALAPQDAAAVRQVRPQTPDELVQDLRPFADLGADVAILRLPSFQTPERSNLDTYLWQLDLMAEHVMPKFA